MSVLFNRCVASTSTIGSVAKFSTSSHALAAVKKAKPGAKGPTKRTAQSFNKAKTGGKAQGQSSSSGNARNEAQIVQVDLSQVIQAEFEPTVAIQGGVPTRFAKQNVSQLEAFGLPRKIAQEFRKGQAASVTRNSSIELLKRLESASTRSSKETRLILSGSQGCGKSMSMLQAMSGAWQQGWIVIYVPQAHELIDSTSPYAYNSKTQIFQQAALSSSLLTSILAANRSLLSKMTLSKDYEASTGQKYTSGTKLDEFISAGAKDTTQSVGTLEVLLEALAEQTQSPVLLAIDEVQALFMRSAYRAPNYDLLESYALSLPRLLTEYVSGRKSFQSGAILTALSHSTAHHATPKEVYVAVSELPSPARISPYDKVNEYHVEAAKGLEVFKVGDKLDLQEARGVLDLCQHRKFIFNVTDETLLGKFAESGGNVNAFIKGLTRTLSV